MAEPQPADGDGTSIDPDSWQYWDESCADMPPMTREEIETVAMALRRISGRRTSVRDEQ